MLERMKRRGRPKKGLAQLVADRSFLARRHSGLLAGPLVADPILASLQQMFRQAGDDRQRRRVALKFERLVREAVPVREPAVEASPEENRFPPAADADDEPVETYGEVVARIWGRQQPFRERGWDPAEGSSPHDWWPGKLTGSQPNTWPSIGDPTPKDDG
jgi:hypothetical protein